MSKTFDLSVEKAQVLVAGIKKNYAELERLGIQWESLKQLEENSARAHEQVPDGINGTGEMASKFQPSFQEIGHANTIRASHIQISGAYPSPAQ